MAKIDDSVWTLRHEIERCTTHADSIRALIRGLHLRLGQAISADYNAAAQAAAPRPPGQPAPRAPEPFLNTQALLDAIGAQSDNLAAAVLANTPPTVTAPTQEVVPTAEEVDAQTKAKAVADAERAMRNAKGDDAKAAAEKKLAEAQALPVADAAGSGWSRNSTAA